MAKKQEQRGQQPQRPQQKAAAAKPTVQKAGSLAAYRPLSVELDDHPLRKIFIGISVLGLVVMLWMALGSGINADEKFQYSYAEKLMNYYATMGKDTSALNVPDGYMHIYGGFFEVTTSVVSKICGFTQNDAGYYHVRHLFSALLGWLAIVFSALLARRIAGWQAGLFTLILLLLSPRFVGESLMNPKDIPFAAGYAIALYFLSQLLSSIENPKRSHIIGLATGIGIALGTRAGGLLLFAYMGLFVLVDMFFRNRAGASFGLMKYVKTLGIPALLGYAFAIAFWPWAIQNPIKAPLDALTKFTQYVVEIRVLFSGENMMSSKVPWNYPINWIALTVPLAALIGLIGGFGLFYTFLKKYQPTQVLLVAFGSIFPIAYVIYSSSNLYDGWRHLTFVYPCMAVMAGLFWNELTRLWHNQKAIKYAIYGFFALGIADAAFFLVRNLKIPYVYFNPLIGGVSGALGNYETDYWGVSIRQGVEWLEKEGILHDKMDKPVIIATNMHFPLLKHTAKYGDKVVAKYLKYERRCEDTWDYALYPTRFMSGETLRKGNFPQENAVHTITAGGAPILAILRDTTKNCSLGTASFKANDFNSAINYLKKEVEQVPDNDAAWGTLANAYLNAGMLNEAKAAAEQTIKLAPNDVQGNNTLGLTYMQMQDLNAARAQFMQAIKKEEQNQGAYYFLALISAQTGDNNGALELLEKCLRISNRFPAAYELAASIHERMGNSAQAAQIRAQIGK